MIDCAGAIYSKTDQEVIVVDDGSSDRTPEILAQWTTRPGFKIVQHALNRGKGAAVRTGISHSTGLVTVIQDADLEYDPSDIPALVAPILEGQAHAVFGSRYLMPGNHLPWTKFRVAVHLMNGIVRVLYGVRLTDVNTCYKVASTDLYRQLQLECERFEFCAEVTAKLGRSGLQILEIPIQYHPRSKAEGKKIGWRDAIEFARTLAKWRWKRVHPIHITPVARVRAVSPPDLAGPILTHS